MRFESLYRISFYAMLVVSSLVMSVDAPDNKIAMLFPLGVALACLVAFLTVDRDPRLGFSKNVADLLSLGSIVLLLIEYKLDEKQLLLALGHWLVYLQIVLIFRKKSVEGDWWLFSLGLVEVLVGCVISQSDVIGIILLCWAILSLWVFGLFLLQREAVRARVGFGGKGAAGSNRGELYPGVFTLQFVTASVRLTLLSLALGGVIFLAMPRKVAFSKNQGNPANAQHLTGFNDEVELGQLGEILENDDVVMSIELFDENNEKITSLGPLQSTEGGEPLWRGVTMTTYERGRWTRQSRKSATFPIIPPSSMRVLDPKRPRGFIRQVIKLEANDSTVLFGLRPMLNASMSRPNDAGPDLNGLDGSIYLNDTRNGTIDYEVRSYRDTDLPQPGENSPSIRRRNLLLSMPDAIRPRFHAIAKSVIEKLPLDQQNDVRAKAKALEHYLRDSGEFGYTLNLDVVNRDLDPVEDFLINRKEGHCEYFASALTLLLRSADIHARIVNGFKGGDWNNLASLMSVRQKHAHSWVEYYAGDVPGSDRSPLWLTLDPTPSTERSLSVAKVGGIAGNFRQSTDFIRYVWVFYILGYSADRQNALVYQPAMRLIREARRGFWIMSEAARDAKAQFQRLMTFRSMKSFFSIRGLAVSFVLLLVALGVIRGVVALARWIYRRFHGLEEGVGAIGAGAAQYRRLATLLARYGLERPPAETQEEFARRAMLYLAGKGDNGVEVVDVPRVVVEAFYQSRFGHLELPEETIKSIESRLDALELSLATAS